MTSLRALSHLVVGRLHRIMRQVRPYVPFTEVNVASHLLGLRHDEFSVLDIGCGTGEPMKFINRGGRLRVVGTDIFAPSLKECRLLGVHGDLVMCDLRYLPFKQKGVDMVICLTVLEHFDADEGQTLLDEMERIALWRVVVTTPVGSYKLGGFGGNPHQEHKHTWSPAEFRARGYCVRGVGIRGMLGEGALQSRLPRVLWPLTWALWVAAGPFVHFIPELAGTQIACWQASKKGGAGR